MVRQLLGNIKGPKGDPGEPGELGPPGSDGQDGVDGVDGGFNGEIVGVNNLFNMSDVHGLNNIGDIDYDVTSGMLTYTGITWNIRTTVRLNNTIHTLYLKDYDSNPAYIGGYIRVAVVDLDNNNIIPQTNVFKNTPLKLDLTSMSEPQDVTLILRVTTGDVYSGYIEQPMLVEGEYTSGWQPSLKDVRLNKAYGMGRFYTSNTLSLEERTLGITGYTNGGIDASSGVLTSNGGPLMFSNTSHFTNWTDGYINLRLKVNGSPIVRVQATSNPVQVNHAIITEPGDEITLTLTYAGDGNPSMAPDKRNQFSIVEI